jgi:hypothetical protein
VAVDEVTAANDHHGVAMAALILPNSLSLGAKTGTGKVRGGLTRKAADTPTPPKRVDVKAPAAPALRPGSRKQNTDFSL